MSEEAERRKVVAEAISWHGTPYHHRARLKYIGVDCAMLPYMVFLNAGLIEPFDIPPYTPDWFLHRGQEVYLSTVLRFAREIQGDQKPGDLMLCRVGRLYAHGAIVISWPRVIHALRQNRKVGYADATADGSLMATKPRFFSYWSK